jgi:basic amino acid/polyamine antiporter, APA family
MDANASAPAPAAPPSEPSGPLFVRQATGLVKGWSALDASIYCFFAISFVAFGFYVFSLAIFIPGGSLFWAAILTVGFVALEVLVYACLMALMPRAGGDYVWQTRVLGGGIGFVLATVGWWFCMWQFVPIYGELMTIQVINPLLGVLGEQSAAEWFLTSDGLFVSSLAVVAICSGWVALGLGGYAKLQKFSLGIGGIGLLVVFALMLLSGQGDFRDAFDREAAAQFGAGADAYQRTLEAGGIDAVGLSFPSETFLLIPLVLFWCMWVIWGAVMAGETRGARDFNRNVASMGGALIVSLVLAVVFFGLVAKTFGWDFYASANNAYWSEAEGTPLATWPSPVMMAGWLVDSSAFQFVLILLNSFWLWALMGTLFLSATRVVFAASFDRVLPEPVSRLTPRRRVPWVALLLLVVPGLVVSALYAYWADFQTLVLSAALLLAVMFLGSAIAAALVPWRARGLYLNSPIARWEVRGVPLITVVGGIFAAFLVFNLYHWLKDDAYGVNHTDSLIYLGALYVIAVGIYVVASIVRRRQGVRLSQVHKEIPVD